MKVRENQGEPHQTSDPQSGLHSFNSHLYRVYISDIISDQSIIGKVKSSSY